MLKYRDKMISKYFNQLQASALRGARQIASNRKDKIKVIDASIGSVSLRVYPAIYERMRNLSQGFKDGSVAYTPTEGIDEAKQALVNIYRALGVDIKGLNIHITGGGSLAMQYAMLGVCETNRPLMGFSPLYANYLSYGKRFNLAVKSMTRILTDDGSFTMPDEREIEKFIEKEKPGALLVIPADNPSGAYFNQNRLESLAKLCVKYDMWMISDEAYFGLYYGKGKRPSSIWRITEKQVKGINGRRIGIHSASKNMNSCGLRIGALVTDNNKLAQKAVNCASADLGSGAIDQYLFAALAQEKSEDIAKFLVDLRAYYFKMMQEFREKLLKLNPDLIVSQPEASIYQVVDFRKVVNKNFRVLEFVNWVAEKGKVKIGDENYIMIGAPMSDFYQVKNGEKNPGDTQMRLAFVRNRQEMLLGAEVLVKELEAYLGSGL